MKEQDHIKAYVQALWESPISSMLIVLDIAGLVGIILIVVDDLTEAGLVALFLAIWFIFNYRVFKQQRETIAGLNDDIARLEAVEANITVAVQGNAKLKIVLDSIDARGLPKKGTVQAILEFENVGREPGELMWELDTAQTVLPRFFSPEPNNIDGVFNPPLHSIDGRERTERRCIIPLRIAAQDPKLLAQALNSRESYVIVIRYHTRRIGGMSPPQELPIELDLQETRLIMRTRWEKHGYSDLAKLIDRD